MLENSVTQRLSIRRELWIVAEAFERDLALACSVAHPDHALPLAHCGNQRDAVWSDSDSFLFGQSGGYLLRLAIREPLPPNVERPTCRGIEEHPFSVRRPAGKGARGAWRAHLTSRRATIHRNEAARQKRPPIHFHEQHPFAVGRQIRPMRHSP